jgi:hypothetical protein
MMFWWFMNNLAESFQKNDLAEDPQQYLLHCTGHYMPQTSEPVTLHFGGSLKRMSSDN